MASQPPVGCRALPPEIWQHIVSNLDDDGCRALCQTSRALLAYAQRMGYSAICLDESASSGESLRAIALGPRAGLVRRITYRPHDPKPLKTLDEKEEHADCELHDPSVKLSDASREVLGSLRRFPNLETLRFSLYEWDLDAWPGGHLGFIDFGSGEEHQAEDVEPWRILVNSSFAALSASAGAFANLELDSIPPVPEDPPYTVLGTIEWTTLLQGLTSLRIDLGSVPERGAGNLTIVQQDFIETFPRIFFDHLSRVQHLRVAGNADGFIGHSDEWDGRPIDWSNVRIPHLRSFELRYAYVERGLGEFLASHTATLEKVYLRWGLAADTGSWRDLLRLVVDADPRRLVDFRVPALPVRERSLHEVLEEERGISDDWVEWRDCEGEDEQDEGAARFLVGRTCESYGIIDLVDPADEDYEEEGWALDEAEAAGEWEKLQAMVRRNRAALERCA